MRDGRDLEGEVVDRHPNVASPVRRVARRVFTLVVPVGLVQRSEAARHRRHRDVRKELCMGSGGARRRGCWEGLRQHGLEEELEEELEEKNEKEKEISISSSSAVKMKEEQEERGEEEHAQSSSSSSRSSRVHVSWESGGRQAGRQARSMHFRGGSTQRCCSSPVRRPQLVRVSEVLQQRTEPRRVGRKQPRQTESGWSPLLSHCEHCRERAVGRWSRCPGDGGLHGMRRARRDVVNTAAQ